MNFSGAVAVALYATTNFGHGLYSVSLDNAAPQIFNGSTFWLVTNTVIFFQSGLDSARTYGLNVINMSGGAKLSLNSAVTYQVDPPPISTTGSSRGTSHAKIAEIVAPIVGVVVLGLIAVFVWLRSRKHREAAATAVSPLILPDRESDPAAPEMRNPTSGKGHAMLTPAPSSASPTSPASAPDVNQIIELIAQRIDRREGSQLELSPPDYDAHSQQLVYTLIIIDATG
ncbi:hypothetical protein DFH06DRAFT_1167453 [Mycena polygramma]|nr:hypothetical protein DFH06DRAFT_1167453 [Mycena polygramma]